MRKHPQQARSRATVDALVEASAQVLGARGWNAFTTNVVAEAAGASVGTVYQYFPDKLSLVAAIRARHRQGVLQAIETATRMPAPLAARVDALVVGLIAMHAGPPELHRALLDDAPRTSCGGEAEEAAGTRFAFSYLRAHAAFIRGCNRRPSGAAPSPGLLAAVLEGAIHFGARTGRLTSASFRRDVCALVLGYLS